jgi:nucleotide-binding universal stress UspA family protein
LYKKILLAYDGSLEGRRALREGALLARQCMAQVFLLSVVAETAGTRMAQGVDPQALMPMQESFRAVLTDGVARLQQLGFKPIAKLVTGEPAREIGAYAREIGADLVVVGYHRRSAIERWWSGTSGAYLVDHIPCSLLVARNVIGDGEFEARMRDSGGPAT